MGLFDENKPVPITFDHRHPSTQHMMKILAPNTNLPPHLKSISEQFASLALEMVETQSDGPELTAGLRSLWNAKNSFVMNAVLDADPDANQVWYTDR